MSVSSTIRELIHRYDNDLGVKYVKNSDKYTKSITVLPKGTVIRVVSVTPTAIYIVVLRCGGNRKFEGETFSLIDTPSWRPALLGIW